MTAAAGQMVAAGTLGHGTAHRGTQLAAVDAAQAGAPLQLLLNIGGPEATDSLVVLPMLAKTCRNGEKRV
jgi:hypothetical protein